MKSIDSGLTSGRSRRRALLAMLWLSLLSPWAISTGHGGLFSYEVANGTVTITKYNSANPNVEVPDILDGLPVTRIGRHAFTECTGLTAIILPNSVTHIQAGAFHGCGRLKILDLPAGLITIESQAFALCAALTDIELPDTVVAIGDGAFMGCSSLTSVTLSSHLTGIADGTFESCGKLASITLPDGVTNIGARAFSCCGITNLEMGQGVVTIGQNAFEVCRKLRRLSVPDQVAKMGDEAFSNCSGLTDVTLGNGLTRLGPSTFFYCTGLVNLHLGNKVAIIDNSAFWDCVSLTDLVLPDSVTQVADGAFEGCTALAGVALGKKLASIGAKAFGGCVQLTRFTVDAANSRYSGQDGVLFNKAQTQLIMCPPQQTGSYAIPSGVTSLGAGAFAGCATLTKLSIPASVASIGDLAFEGCLQLTSISVDAANRSFLDQEGVLFNKTRNLLILHPANRTGTYVPPSGVKTIGTGAFSHCAGLTEISLPDSVTTVQSSAFAACTGLTTFTLPRSVATLELSAFNGCTRLTNITVQANNANFSSRSGILYNKDQSILVLCPCGMTDDISLPAGVRSIGTAAFYGCAKLRRITLPNQVTSLGTLAFANCTGLTNLVCGNRLATIGDFAFQQCSGLAELHFFGKLPSVGMNAFTLAGKAKVYYLAGAAGWSASFAGMPTDTWTPTFTEGAAVYGLAEKYPDASGKTDDADQDGMTNAQEIAAGTDPTAPASFLAFEAAARPANLTLDDQTPIDARQFGLYFRSVPGKSYNILSSGKVLGPWSVVTNVTATTTQTRVLRVKPAAPAFYRIALSP